MPSPESDLPHHGCVACGRGQAGDKHTCTEDFEELPDPETGRNPFFPCSYGRKVTSEIDGNGVSDHFSAVNESGVHPYTTTHGRLNTAIGYLKALRDTGTHDTTTILKQIGADDD